MKRLTVVSLCLLYISGVVFGDSFGSGENQIEIDFVNISGDASNANGTNISLYPPDHFASQHRSFTDPGNFRIGKFEITNNQWNKFTNIYGEPTGSPSYAYDQDSYWTNPQVPVNRVSWYEAAQFVNWLNEIKGYDPAYKFIGTRGASDYTFMPWDSNDLGFNPNNPYRNENAFYFLPTEDEFVKAAYWNGTTLQTYATTGDVIPVAEVDSFYGQIDGPWDGPWDVGRGTEELNGTYDMMGNATEWMESTFYGAYFSHSIRCHRGGGYFTDINDLTSSYRYSIGPSSTPSSLGFRVASIPEPYTILFFGFGALVLRIKR